MELKQIHNKFLVFIKRNTKKVKWIKKYLITVFIHMLQNDLYLIIFGEAFTVLPRVRDILH